ncbi:MAG: hypothetical protein AAFY91_14520, partial [Bacteroidota bacterium]
VDACKQFSFDRWLNREVATYFQRKFISFHPQSGSFRLWGNLLIDRELPEPAYTKTLPDRQQLVDYQRAEREALEKLVKKRIEGAKRNSKNPLSVNDWLQKTRHWRPLIRAFQRRGGQLVFVRMPVSQSRWQFTAQAYPPKYYWNTFADRNNVYAVHFDEYPTLSQFELPDTSHLAYQSKAEFTRALYDILDTTYHSDVFQTTSEEVLLK